MLNTLRKIVQEVNSAKDLKAALGIIVQRVKEAMGTQVCSVYLLDTETQRFVLMATEGLNKRSIGKVSMAPSEGLVGLVGTREEPLNLENAAAHPRYRYFAETGEERYASFLGAPIIHHRRVMGVLVVQQKERRQFDEGEEAFLVTMSAQLAGVIAHAEATGSIRGLGKLGKGIQEAKFVGVPGAPGVGVARRWWCCLRPTWKWCRTSRSTTSTPRSPCSSRPWRAFAPTCARCRASSPASCARKNARCSTST